MKKVYMQPQTAVVMMEHNLPIAGSDPHLIVDKNGGAAPGSFETKGDRGSRSDYNVWNEDWSNN